MKQPELCEHCDTEIGVYGRMGCPQCGAPVCCKKCCNETTDYLHLFNKAPVTAISVEQRIRNALERMEIPGAQNYSAGDLVELSNMVRGIDALATQLT